MKKEQRTGLDSIRAVAQYNLHIWETTIPYISTIIKFCSWKKLNKKKKADDKNTENFSRTA